MLIKGMKKIAVSAITLGFIVGCDQIPVAGEGDEDSSTEALSGGSGFADGTAQRGQGVPQSALDSLLGAWQGECEQDRDDQGQPDDAMSQTNTDPALDPALDPAAVNDPQAVALLEGEESKPTEFKREKVRFTREGAIHSDATFIDSSCSEDSRLFEFLMNMNYKVGGEVAGASGARELDLKFMGGAMVIYHSDAISMANSVGMCGKSDWQSGVPAKFEDLDLAQCDKGKGGDGEETSPDPVPTALNLIQSEMQQKQVGVQDDGGDRQGDGPPELGQVMTEIFKVEGDKLFFGARDYSGDGRPTELDQDRPLSRLAE